MFSKILILHFPISEVGKPIVCSLAKDYNLTFNILNAAVLPRKEGMMVLDLSGSRKDFKEGVQYLKNAGVKVKNASQEVKRLKNRCVHCGACTAVCPTGALAVEQPDMQVNFFQKKSGVCDLCIPACPTRAMVARPTNQAFF